MRERWERGEPGKRGGRSGERLGAAKPAQAVVPVAWSVVRCPSCRGQLVRRGDEVSCASCARVMSLDGGVLRCVAHDAFYEEAYLNEIRYVPGRSRVKDWIFFSLLQSGVFGKVRDVLAPDAIVLDLGCASGVRWLGTFHTIGVDLSFASVSNTRDFYEVPIQATADRLPVASDSVDVVYSSYFFEHVPPEDKETCLREIHRVLRPDGACVMLFDVLSDGLFGRFARRDPEAFRRGFVARDGHVGLEPLSVTMERMAQVGLRIHELAKFGTTPLQYMASYCWLDDAYGASVPWVRLLGSVARRISASRMRLPIEFAITGLDRAINHYSLPDNATRAIVVARKQSN